ncbi:MAG: 50S ribosomal protein L6 [Alphaproteobacteria bacterium]|nr:50S ribosomal protein L6 [Alphaproteobacteria bacterium]
MSRIGKLPITVPSGVQVDIKDHLVTVKGQKGELKQKIVGDVSVTINDGEINVKPANDTKRARAMWGMSRTLINNMITGVTDGFTKRLEIRGVGFRASVDGKILNLSLGFSHEIKYAIPEGISIVAEKPTLLVISGTDAQKVGQTAALLRSLRKPEPYKGKGVRYENERVIMKEGKKK